jgi:hypothetical protein
VQPSNAPLDSNQWVRLTRVASTVTVELSSLKINITVSALPSLQSDEAYRCVFADQLGSVSTRAFLLDRRHVSCPTPSSRLVEKRDTGEAHALFDDAGRRTRTALCKRSPIVELIAGHVLNMSLSLMTCPSNTSVTQAVPFVLFNCSFHSSCASCNGHVACRWCSNRCSANCVEPTSPCQSLSVSDSSFRIRQFSPRRVVCAGGTQLTIDFDQIVVEDIERVFVARLPCQLFVRLSTGVQCRSAASTSPRRGPIEIHMRHSNVIVVSNDSIDYVQPVISHVTPRRVFEYGGQLLHLIGHDLLVGHERRVFIGPYECIAVDADTDTDTNNVLSCQLPSMPSALYNVTVRFDTTTIVVSESPLLVTPNPVVRLVSPRRSFVRLER